MPNAGFNHTCLAVITIDSVIEKDEKDESTLKKKNKWLNVLLWTSNVFWFWRRISFFNKRLKKFPKHQKFALCKRLTCHGYPFKLSYLYPLEYKGILGAKLSTSYIAYQSVFIYMVKQKSLPWWKKSHNGKVFRRNVLATPSPSPPHPAPPRPAPQKILTTPDKDSKKKKISHNKRKIITAKEKSSQQKIIKIK